MDAEERESEEQREIFYSEAEVGKIAVNVFVFGVVLGTVLTLLLRGIAE